MSTVSIRYMIDDVPAAIKFYTTHLGFALDLDASPAFASVSRDGVRLLLSGKTSSGRRAMPDGREPVPGGWNRIHIQVDDLEAEVKRLPRSGPEVPQRNRKRARRLANPARRPVRQSRRIVPAQEEG